MAKVTKIDVLSSAKVLATLMAFVGLLAGVLYSFGGAIFEIATGVPLNAGTALAFLALIGMPIIFGIPGLLIGVIGAFLYNVAAKWVGGIEADFE